MLSVGPNTRVANKLMTVKAPAFGGKLGPRRVRGSGDGQAGWARELQVQWTEVWAWRVAWGPLHAGVECCSVAVC